MASQDDRMIACKNGTVVIVEEGEEARCGPLGARFIAPLVPLGGQIQPTLGPGRN